MDDPPELARPFGEVKLRLRGATARLESMLGTEVWERLHPHARSSLVTAQIYFDILRTLDAARDDNDVWVGGKTAPLVDFSPVVLFLFKAVEIELAYKVFRPFARTRLAEGAASRVTHRVTPPVTDFLHRIRLSDSKLGLTTMHAALGALGEIGAETPPALVAFKRWMRDRFVRPERLWGKSKLSMRFGRVVEAYRNPAAHTGRLAPRPALSAWVELWGDPPRAAVRRSVAGTGGTGVIPTMLRAIEPRPVADDEVCGFRVIRALSLRRSQWLLEATDEHGDRHRLTLVRGDASMLERSLDGFKTRKQVVHRALVSLSGARRLAVEPIWGKKIATCVREEGTALASEPLGEGESLAMARDLAGACAALHEQGLVHGMISPAAVVRRADGTFALGEQSIHALAEAGAPLYQHPRVRAPEVHPSESRSLTKASDVFAIAAAVCCARSPRAARGTFAPTLEEVARMFSEPMLVAALSRALAPAPGDRFADAGALLFALSEEGQRRVAPSGESLFLSYSRDDAALADLLVPALQRLGYSVFRDVDGLVVGAAFRMDITIAIRSCDALLFLATARSIGAGRYARKEVYFALKAGKPVIPVLVDDIELPDDLELELGPVHQLRTSSERIVEVAASLATHLSRQGILPRDARRDAGASGVRR